MRWKRSRWWLVAVALGLAACSGQTAANPVPLTPYPTLDAAQVARGREVYVQSCARCHGQNAEGAPNWATPGPDGALYLAPPHDDTGHTWHHSDRVLYMTIYGGMGDPLLVDAPLRMPPFGGSLSDADIRTLIVYFRSLWSEEHRLYQWRETLKDFAPTPTPSP